jgi:hypothetical protein
MIVTVNYGHTMTDRGANYVPAMDGWKAGARQVILTLTLDVPDARTWGATPENVAEAIYMATNAPRSIWSPLAILVDVALEPYRQDGQRTYVMDVGDTVVCWTRTSSPVFLECRHAGFDRRSMTDLYGA